ncbi:MAG: glucan biosynthesis protein G [Hyphomonadaceae bacterium]|nr:glucan biosynthesis protein G [Hyphomonadaceae bacterium]
MQTDSPAIEESEPATAELSESLPLAESAPEEIEREGAVADVSDPDVTAVEPDTELDPEVSPVPVPEDPARAESEESFGFRDVADRARELSEAPFRNPAPLPQSAASLNYDTYRRIKARDTATLWNEPGHDFRVAFDPRGYLFTHEVQINLISGDTVEARPYSAEDFNFFDLPLNESAKENLGFSGFRLLAPLNRSGKFDEVLSFKGASFFRALGAGNVFGASARGLSLGTATASGEEFPFFKEFWIVTPAPGDEHVRLYALMDSASVTGAFAFDVRPGQMTEIEVDAVFFPRRELRTAGIAPLTSMYYFSPQDVRQPVADFRPAVHDSEGFAIRMKNGEWVWRPLANPETLQISVLTAETPRGFGLLQRQRDFDDFSDIEAGYEKRPNLWIEPKGDWGNGQLTLVEIPTTNEYNDNIVAFWRPTEPWKVGTPQSLSYTMTWSMAPPQLPSVVAVAQTRAGVTPGSGGRRYMFVIDYDSTSAALFEGAEPFVTSSRGRVLNRVLTRHPGTGRPRMTFEFDPEGADIAEFRALVTKAGRPITETWLYRWRPE